LPLFGIAPKTQRLILFLFLCFHFVFFLILKTWRNWTPKKISKINWIYTREKNKIPFLCQKMANFHQQKKHCIRDIYLQNRPQGPSLAGIPVTTCLAESASACRVHLVTDYIAESATRGQFSHRTIAFNLSAQLNI